MGTPNLKLIELNKVHFFPERSRTILIRYSSPKKERKNADDPLETLPD